MTGTLGFLLGNESGAPITVTGLSGECTNGIFATAFQNAQLFEVHGFRELQSRQPSLQGLLELPVLTREDRIVVPANTDIWILSAYRLVPLWDEAEFKSKGGAVAELRAWLPEGMGVDARKRNAQAYFAGVRLHGEFKGIEPTPALSCDWSAQFAKGRVVHSQAIPIAFPAAVMDHSAFVEAAKAAYNNCRETHLITVNPEKTGGCRKIADGLKNKAFHARRV